jgi:hypothetical protein
MKHGSLDIPEVAVADLEGAQPPPPFVPNLPLNVSKTRDLRPKIRYYSSPRGALVYFYDARSLISPVL